MVSFVTIIRFSFVCVFVCFFYAGHARAHAHARTRARTHTHAHTHSLSLSRPRRLHVAMTGTWEMITVSSKEVVPFTELLLPLRAGLEERLREKLQAAADIGRCRESSVQQSASRAEGAESEAPVGERASEGGAEGAGSEVSAGERATLVQSTPVAHRSERVAAAAVPPLGNHSSSSSSSSTTTTSTTTTTTTTSDINSNATGNPTLSPSSVHLATNSRACHMIIRRALEEAEQEALACLGIGPGGDKNRSDPPGMGVAYARALSEALQCFLVYNTWGHKGEFPVLNEAETELLRVLEGLAVADDMEGAGGSGNDKYRLISNGQGRGT